MINRYVHKSRVLRCVFIMLLFCASVLLVSKQLHHSAIALNGQVNFDVKDVLTISVTTPDTGAVGNADTFLRNEFGLSVSTNNGNGFTASMNAKSSTANLVNILSSSNTIPTLTTSYTRGNFPTNYWGYSLDDAHVGQNSSTYNKIAASGSTPNTIISSYDSLHGINSRTIYFGAKASTAKASGTYSATVVFSVVSDTIGTNNPVIPTDPVVPGGDTPANPEYNSSRGSTVYTTATTSNDGTTTTTEISKGDNRSGYAAPQGVTTTVATNIGEGTPLATGLAATAAVAATTGAFFFIIAKRKKDDDEEEDDLE